MPESPSPLPHEWFVETETALSGLSTSFASAEPFPHTVIDSFLPEDIAKQCAEAFPAPGSEQWIHYAHLNSAKWGMTDLESMPGVLRGVTVALNSPQFTRSLSTLSQVPDLESDPMLSGGGLHVSRQGGFLNVHTDFVSHPLNRTWRRQLNLLLYLTEDWDEAWGGHLELWDADMRSAVQRVEPKFNRCVIFRTSTTSYHGVPEPLNTPGTTQRNSLALYYFSDERRAVKPRATSYRPRPSDGRRSVLLKADNAVLAMYSRLRLALRINDQSIGRFLGKFRREK